jgi:IclR family transcriptional regulator, KDG regulon repressor
MLGHSGEGDVRLPAVDRTADLLELLASSSIGLTLSEICRLAHIPKSSAHYLVYTLMMRGFLQRNLDGRTYSLGSRLTALTDAGDADRQVKLATRPILREIALKVGLPGLATVLKGVEACLVEVANPPGRKWGGQWVGRHLESHCTAHGKALLAYLPGAELDLLFNGRPLARFTPKTICSLPLLKQHLAGVRAEGFAINDEEHVTGIRGIAAPVFDHVGNAIAAVGVSGSTTELPNDRFPAVIHLLASASLEISRKFLEALPRTA